MRVIIVLALITCHIASQSQTLDKTMMSKMDSAIKAGVYPNIHSVLVSKDNQLLYENYWAGKDEIWGDDIGVVPHSRDSLHDIRSISKSIVSACVGIAIKQGKIRNVDQKVFEFFPEFRQYDTGAKSQLTLKHLLTMTSGLIWNEDVPYTDPENSEIRMVASSNPVEFVLMQPMEATPGQKWKYNGGTTQLLAAVIEKTTGKRIDKYAEEFLFKPLGITKYVWIKYPGTDLPTAASGLRLRPIDILAFGRLYMNKGKFEGKEIIPGPWVEESFTQHIQRGNNESYGYQFWIWSGVVAGRQIQTEAAVGNGDQRIFFNRYLNLVVVVTAGNYNNWTIQKGPLALMLDFIYPALGVPVN